MSPYNNYQNNWCQTDQDQGQTDHFHSFSRLLKKHHSHISMAQYLFLGDNIYSYVYVIQVILYHIICYFISIYQVVIFIRIQEQVMKLLTVVFRIPGSQHIHFTSPYYMGSLNTKLDLNQLFSPGYCKRYYSNNLEEYQVYNQALHHIHHT